MTTVFVEQPLTLPGLLTTEFVEQLPAVQGMIIRNIYVIAVTTTYAAIAT